MESLEQAQETPADQDGYLGWLYWIRPKSDKKRIFPELIRVPGFLRDKRDN